MTEAAIILLGFCASAAFVFLVCELSLFRVLRAIADRAIAERIRNGGKR